MSAMASAALAAVRAAGGDVVLTDGRLRLVASSPLPAEVVEQVTAAKSDLLALLSNASSGWDATDWHAFYDERAGIAEFDGGLSRPEAEARAWECSVAHWINMTPPVIDSADHCPVCGRPVGTIQTGAIPTARPGGGYVWLHRGCHAQFMIRRRVDARRALVGVGLKPSQGWTP